MFRAGASRSCCSTASAGASALRVGPGLPYEMPCRAVAAASDGCTIQIDASGNYSG